MSHDVVVVLWAMVAFQLKHFLCDFTLQTPYQIENKGNYGHIGGIIHSGLHALFSIFPLLILTRAPLTILALIAAEFVVHYHADFVKARIDRRYFLSGKTASYWVVFGADQLVHQLTYIAMIAVALTGL